MSIIIGVDPGLQRTGWAIVQFTGSSLIELGCGVLRPDTHQDLAARLLTIHEGLKEVILEYSPTKAAIENIYVNTNSQSSLLLAHARGVALMTLAMWALEPKEYQASTIKKAVTGSGRASKEQVSHMVSILTTKNHSASKPQTTDATDAMAVAICHAYLL